MLIRKEHGFSGTTNPEKREYEDKHAKISNSAACEGFVLLKNEEGLLPLKKGIPVVLYGSGATKTIKGGTGSGDVNERSIVTIYDGLNNYGFKILNQEWLKAYDREYEIKKAEWKEEIYSKIEDASGYSLFDAYCSTPFHIPAGDPIEDLPCDTAIYVLSRVSGEGADRTNGQGDYLLTQEEETRIEELCNFYDNVVLLLNTGGIIDLEFTNRFSNIKSILYILQPGMEAGNAVAKILSGEVTPSGKLTDSWAIHYEDYPNSKTFSHNDHNVEKEFYNEGIYVGYRYFDTFQIPVKYGFGHGLSYSEFEIETKKIEKIIGTKTQTSIRMEVSVKNTGSQYSGKEVVQIYVSLPTGKLEKEYRRLVAFKKTDLLRPGDEQYLTLTFSIDLLSSYSQEQAAWLLEKGKYGVFAGNSLQDSKLVSGIELNEDCIVEKNKNICYLKEELSELHCDQIKREHLYQRDSREIEELPVLTITEDEIFCKEYKKNPPTMNGYSYRESTEGESTVQGENFYSDTLEIQMEKILSQLTLDKKILLVTGAYGLNSGTNLGATGVSVPGSAGETSSCAVDEGIAPIVLADGPAGLRLNKTYQVLDNKVVPSHLAECLAGGYLSKDTGKKEGTTHYQYCTAIPIGTLLAQTWDVELMESIGDMIGVEMEIFHVSLWLAPGMNIHRNPLCGRNFEYYSEDPLLSGIMAAAITKGVQKNPGCGTTIKHFACNNQEDNRLYSDSIVSERALRELYLRGFQIAVESSQPMSIMTSYNLINGIHAANNKDLCTQVARNEWGFEGFIMTDWTTTEHGPECTASGCMRAGNDLIMPGALLDTENLKEELKKGTLKESELDLCISRLLRIILASNQYENAAAYGEKKELIEWMK